MPDNPHAWEDLLVGMKHPDVDEKPMEYAQKKHDERYRGGVDA